MQKKLFLFIGFFVILGSILGSIFLFPSSSCEASDTGCTLETLRQDVVYLDVREDDEWIAGHVQGATHLKMGEILAGNYDSIPQDQIVYVYCRSGRRAGEVIRFLEEKGFTNLINAGGLEELSGVSIIEWP